METDVHDHAVNMDTVMVTPFLKNCGVDMVMYMDFHKRRGADGGMNFEIKMIKS